MKMRIMTILLLVFMSAGADRVQADLIVNGDFSSGATGFSTGYAYVDTTAVNLTAAQTYTIVNDPLDAHGVFSIVRRSHGQRSHDGR